MDRMFELEAQGEFAAAHAIVINGAREAVHGHNWRVTATIAGSDLDQEQLLCDFHELEGGLREILAPWHNRHLNECEPFASREGRPGLNPTAEAVARTISDRLQERLGPILKGRARVASVRVTEAPGCAATYRAYWPMKGG
jgi:6-pyruvoyltetrahydropterin/6-carboxytetrahydropterin synthase